MGILSKSITDWTQSDLQSLVNDKTEESVMLDFKRKLSLKTPAQKKEVAKDVSAMANSSGGWIIYGIDEPQERDSGSFANDVCPFEIGTLCDTLDNILNSAITPAPQFRIHPIPCGGGEGCIVVRIEPHTGSLCQASDRFYRRSDYASRPMTQPEIRDAFARFGDRENSIRKRFDEIRERASAVCSGASYVLCLIPDTNHWELDPYAVAADKAVMHAVSKDGGRLTPSRLGLEDSVATPNDWTLIGRDATLVIAAPAHKHQLFWQHALGGVRDVVRLGGKLSEAFGVHTTWHIGVELRAPLSLKSSDYDRRFVSQLGASTHFTLPVSQRELLTDWERVVARFAKRLYQDFGREECALVKGDELASGIREQIEKASQR